MTDWYRQNKPLAEKLDKAWMCYCDETKDLQTRRNAQDFLIYVFDLQDTRNLNLELIQRMQEREAKKALDPDYIPGITILSDKKIQKLSTLTQQIKRATLLMVCNFSIGNNEQNTAC